MTSTNLNIILTNAVCCAATLAAKVSKLYSTGNKCADSELAKLKLLNDYIETLRCYKIDSIPAKFRYRTVYAKGSVFKQITNPKFMYTITINNITYSLQGDGIKTRLDIIAELLNLSTNIISYSYSEDPDDSNPRYSYLNIEASCDTTSITYSEYEINNPSNIIIVELANYQIGVCTVSNCLTDKEYQTLIEYVMSTCDICECQLNQ